MAPATIVTRAAGGFFVVIVEPRSPAYPPRPFGDLRSACAFASGMVAVTGWPKRDEVRQRAGWQHFREARGAAAGCGGDPNS